MRNTKIIRNEVQDSEQSSHFAGTAANYGCDDVFFAALGAAFSSLGDGVSHCLCLLFEVSVFDV